MKKIFLPIFFLLVTSCGVSRDSNNENPTSVNSPSSTEQNFEQFASNANEEIMAAAPKVKATV